MEGAYLNETRVDQDTSAGRIHDTTDSRGGRASGVVSRSDTQTHCNSDRGGEAVYDSTGDRDPVVSFVELEEGETRTDPETLKRFYRSDQ